MVEWEICHWKFPKNELTIHRITLKMWEQVQITYIELCIYHQYYNKIPNVHTLLKL
jgi:hypothetical protein